jgi:hypothetical protein
MIYAKDDRVTACIAVGLLATLRIGRDAWAVLWTGNHVFRRIAHKISAAMLPLLWLAALNIALAICKKEE